MSEPHRLLRALASPCLSTFSCWAWGHLKTCPAAWTMLIAAVGRLLTPHELQTEQGDRGTVSCPPPPPGCVITGSVSNAGARTVLSQRLWALLSGPTLYPGSIPGQAPSLGPAGYAGFHHHVSSPALTPRRHTPTSAVSSPSRSPPPARWQGCSCWFKIRLCRDVPATAGLPHPEPKGILPARISGQGSLAG